MSHDESSSSLAFRSSDPCVQLLPEAAHLSALHHPSGDGQSRSGAQRQPRRGTANLQRQQQMVCSHCEEMCRDESIFVITHYHIEASRHQK